MESTLRIRLLEGDGDSIFDDSMLGELLQEECQEAMVDSASEVKMESGADSKLSHAEVLEMAGPKHAESEVAKDTPSLMLKFDTQLSSGDPQAAQSSEIIQSSEHKGQLDLVSEGGNGGASIVDGLQANQAAESSAVPPRSGSVQDAVIEEAPAPQGFFDLDISDISSVSSLNNSFSNFSHDSAPSMGGRGRRRRLIKKSVLPSHQASSSIVPPEKRKKNGVIPDGSGIDPPDAVRSRRKPLLALKKQTIPTPAGSSVAVVNDTPSLVLKFDTQLSSLSVQEPPATPSSEIIRESSTRKGQNKADALMAGIMLDDWGDGGDSEDDKRKDEANGDPKNPAVDPKKQVPENSPQAKQIQEQEERKAESGKQSKGQQKKAAGAKGVLRKKAGLKALPMIGPNASQDKPAEGTKSKKRNQPLLIEVGPAAKKKKIDAGTPVGDTSLDAFFAPPTPLSERLNRNANIPPPATTEADLSPIGGDHPETAATAAPAKSSPAKNMKQAVPKATSKVIKEAVPKAAFGPKAKTPPAAKNSGAINKKKDLLEEAEMAYKKSVAEVRKILAGKEDGKEHEGESMSFFCDPDFSLPFMVGGPDSDSDSDAEIIDSSEDEEVEPGFYGLTATQCAGIDSFNVPPVKKAKTSPLFFTDSKDGVPECVLCSEGDVCPSTNPLMRCSNKDCNYKFYHALCHMPCRRGVGTAGESFVCWPCEFPLRKQVQWQLGDFAWLINFPGFSVPIPVRVCSLDFSDEYKAYHTALRKMDPLYDSNWVTPDKVKVPKTTSCVGVQTMTLGCVSVTYDQLLPADAITSMEDALNFDKATGQKLTAQELESYHKHYSAWRILRDNVKIAYTVASRACRTELDAKFPDGDSMCVDERRWREVRVSKLVAQVLDLYSMEAPHCEVFDGEMVRSHFRLEALFQARDQDEEFWNQPSKELRTQVGRNYIRDSSISKNDPRPSST